MIHPPLLCRTSRVQKFTEPLGAPDQRSQRSTRNPGSSQRACMSPSSPTPASVKAGGDSFGGERVGAPGPAAPRAQPSPAISNRIQPNQRSRYGGGQPRPGGGETGAAGRQPGPPPRRARQAVAVPPQAAAPLSATPRGARRGAGQGGRTPPAALNRDGAPAPQHPPRPVALSPHARRGDGARWERDAAP